MAKAKERTFHSSVKGLLPLAIAGLVAATILVILGLWGLRAVPPQLKDPMLRFVAAFLPFILVAIILLVLALLYWSASGRKFVLTPDSLYYEDRTGKMVCRWQDVRLIRPLEDKPALLQSALVSDGKNFARIQKALFPDYELLVSVIEFARTSRKEDINL
ncbi:MAG: hypothetical protein HY319_00030 [Armatimonadetes bacterium]|nr:hypothetical protein [Armatimonadota bacterium]